MKSVLLVPLVGLFSSTLFGVGEPTFHIAPVEVSAKREGAWLLQDRLIEHSDLFWVSPSYSVMQRRFRDTPTAESDLLMVTLSLGRDRPWKERDLDGAQVHFVWLRDGRIEWAQEMDAVGKFHPSGVNAAMAVRTFPGGAELAGSPAVLVSKAGEFIAPRPWFGDDAVANRVAFKIAAGIREGLAEDVAALPNPNVRSRLFQGVTLAHIAAESGNVSALEILADAGTNLDSEDRDRTTPLWWAVGKDRLAAVEWLLERGAKVRANLAGEHLIESAVRRGNMESAAAIYRRKRGSVLRDNVLGGAAYAGRRELSRELLADYGDFRLRWIDGEPLWWVAQSNDVELMRLMLDRGVSIRRFPRSVPMLNLAARAGDLAMVQLLAERGAKLSARDPHGRTALMEATFGGHATVAAWLVAQGAEVSRKDKEGFSALDYARQRSDARLLAVLTGEGRDAALAEAELPVYLEPDVDSLPHLCSRPKFRMMRENKLEARSSYQSTVVITSLLSVGGQQVLDEAPGTEVSHSISSAESTAHFAIWTGIVEADGAVSLARVLSAGPGRFEASVEERMGDYRFDPARRQGAPVRSSIVWVEDLRGSTSAEVAAETEL